MTVCIIGDVHGRADYLRELIDKVRERFGADVRFMAVGDLIDRGPDPRGVVEIAVQEGIESICGNHETWLIDLLALGRFDDMVLNPMMGGASTLRSYGLNIDSLCYGTGAMIRNEAERIPAAHREYMLGLPLWNAVDVAGVRYWITHGGLKAAAVGRLREAARDQIARLTEELLIPIAAQVELDSLLWEHHTNFPLYRFEDGSVQVLGHAPQDFVVMDQWHIALDTGCGRKRLPNDLSAVVLTDAGERHVITGGRWRRSLDLTI